PRRATGLLLYSGSASRTIIERSSKLRTLRRDRHWPAMVSKPHIQLEALHGLARALAGGEFRARAVLDRACAAVAEGFAFERVGIVRFVAETSTLIPFAAHGLTTAELSSLPTAPPIRRFSAFQTALMSGPAVFVEAP